VHSSFRFVQRGRFRVKSLVSKVSLALLALAVPSLARGAEFSAVIDATGAYSYTKLANPTPPPAQKQVHINQFGGSGAALVTFNQYFNVQMNAGYTKLAGTGSSDLFAVAIDAYWRDRKGAIGLSLGYGDVGAPAAPYFSGSKNLEIYGLFGEYYPFDRLTLHWKVGGASGVVGGGYGGAGIVWYDSPDLALHIDTNFTAFRSGHDWWSLAPTLEFLPFSNFPLTVYAGYDRTWITGGNHLQTVFTGLRYHFGRYSNLVSIDRNGPTQWDGRMTPGGQLKF